MKEKIKHLYRCHLRAVKRIKNICQHCWFHDQYGCFFPDPKGMEYIKYHLTVAESLIKILSIIDEEEEKNGTENASSSE